MTKTVFVYPSKTRHASPPLGIAYIASYLRNNGHDVEIIDFNVVRDDDEFKKIISRKSPDLVGLSMQTNAMSQTYKLIKVIKDVTPGALVVLGGPHPTVMPELTLQDSLADFIVMGEGEETFLDIANSIRDGEIRSPEKIRGVWFRKGSKISQTPPRPFIEDLDEIPFPARDLLPVKEFYLKQVPPTPLIMPIQHIICHRGCPFNCIFCQPTSRKMFGIRVRRRSPANICDEAESVIREYKLKSVYFSADTLTADEKWIKDFCREYKNRDDIPWIATTRVDTVNRSILTEMKRSGCYFIAFGVESGSEKILRFLRKGIDKKQVKKAIDLCSEIGIMTQSNIMIGNPGETSETLEATYDFIGELSTDIVAPFITNPIVGTDLYDYVIENDMLLSQSFDQMSRHTPGNIKLESLTQKQLYAFRERLIMQMLSVRMRSIMNPRKGHVRRVLAKRWISILRSAGFSSFGRSYEMMQTTQKDTVKKLVEMVVKGI